MDFETATSLAQDLNARDTKLVVAGLRRTDLERHDSWALDIIDPASGRMETLDEKDAWDVRLRRAFPDAFPANQ